MNRRSTLAETNWPAPVLAAALRTSDGEGSLALLRTGCAAATTRLETVPYEPYRSAGLCAHIQDHPEATRPQAEKIWLAQGLNIDLG